MISTHETHRFPDRVAVDGRYGLACTVSDGRERVVAQVGPDARQVNDWCYSPIRQRLGCTNSGDHQQLRRSDRTCGQYHFCPAPDRGGVDSGFDFYADAAPGSDQEFENHCVRYYLQVWAVQHRFEVCVKGALPSAGNDIVVRPTESHFLPAT